MTQDVHAVKAPITDAAPSIKNPHNMTVFRVALAAAGYCQRNASLYSDPLTLVEDMQRDSNYALDHVSEEELANMLAPLVYARGFAVTTDTEPPRKTPKPPDPPLRRLRREMELERGRLIFLFNKRINGIWPDDVKPQGDWFTLKHFWHGPDRVAFSFGTLVAFDGLRRPIIQVTTDRYAERPWHEFPLEDLWELLPTLRKMRGRAKGRRVEDPFEKRDETSPRYHYWARRAAAGFVPNKRYWMEGYYGRCLKLGVTDKERKVLDEMFIRNKERL